jgi:hypothetical protein
MRIMLACALALATGAASAEGWVCATDSIVGFAYDAKTDRWAPKPYRTDSNYVVRRPIASDGKDYQGAKWVVLASGEKVPSSKCAGTMEEGCVGYLRFRMDTGSLRFISENSVTLLDSKAELERVTKAMPASRTALHSAAFEIGKCTPL